MAIDHLSLYQLTIEQGTAFGDRYNRGKLRGLPSDDVAADMYELTQDLCEKAGMPAYEVSNHARDGSQSRHNLIYWRYGDYIGIGPGAHGRVTLNGQRYATETRLQPSLWLKDVARGNGDNLRQSIDQRDQGIEYVMMGLRINQGIQKSRYTSISTHCFDQEILDHLSEIGMIEQHGDFIRTTRDGRAVLNTVIEAILPAD